jgi:hypothetical protein
MALSNMEVFNQFLYSSATETVRQQVELFNAASGGALVMSQAQNVGDVSNEVYFKEIANLIRRRDAYGSGAVTPTTLEQLNHVSIKVAGGTSPVNFDPSQFTWIQQNPEQAGVVYGEQIAQALVQDQLNTAILGLQTVMSGNTDVQFDGTASTLNLSALNKGAAKFGDRSGDLRAWVLHSKAMHDLYDGALSNGQDLFNFGTVNIRQDGFGRRLIMTDSPALYGADAGGVDVDHYYTLGLASDAARVEDNGDYYATLEEKTGFENIQRTFQAEYTYNLSLKGYSWDSSVKSPSDAAIGSGANWTQIATDVKSTAGVMVTSL